MAGRHLDPADVPTPGPWLVRVATERHGPPETVLVGSEPATNDGLCGWPYLIRQARPMKPDSMPIAAGIPRLADARMMAAAPELADALVRLLTSPELNRQGIDPRTQRVRDAAWVLLMRVAPHLEIGAWS